MNDEGVAGQGQLGTTTVSALMENDGISRTLTLEAWSYPFPPPHIMNQYPLEIQKAILERMSLQLTQKHELDLKQAENSNWSNPEYTEIKFINEENTRTIENAHAEQIIKLKIFKNWTYISGCILAVSIVSGTIAVVLTGDWRAAASICGAPLAAGLAAIIGRHFFERHAPPERRK